MSSSPTPPAPGTALDLDGVFGRSAPRVLEIGPGRGALTEHLLDRYERVRALEVDEALRLHLAI